ncbi:MAG: hypothetical protein IPK46_00250 [Saprospiraceae bacterium]|nr:hypothetical protein [Saprospiraceae bacterium]
MGCSILLSAQTSYTTRVEGACGMCKDRIEEAALKTIGVLKADWNEETKILTLEVEAQLFAEMELHRAIANVGHDTEN